MSVEIDWPLLTEGESGDALATQIRDFLDAKFQTVSLPRFLQSVKVHDFRFGPVPPKITLRDVCDPLPEFYEEEESGSEASNEEQAEAGKHTEDVKSTALDKLPLRQESISASKRSGAESLNRLPSFIDTTRAGLRYGSALGSPSSAAATLTTPGLLSRTNTMGGAFTPTLASGPASTGGSYFNLPLHPAGAGLGVGPPGVGGLAGYPGMIDPPGAHDAPGRRERRESSLASSQSRPSTAHSRHPSLTFPADPEPLTPGAAKPPVTPRPEDIQTLLSVQYSGPLHISLTASLLLDYPMPSFVEIPLKLQVRHVAFGGVAVVAYIRRCVHFCFLGREEGELLVAGQGSGEDDDGIDDEERDGELLHEGAVSGMGHGEGEKEGREQRVRDENPTGSLLAEIKVESEIGAISGVEAGVKGEKQHHVVLKNVGKVERFVVGRVRKMFEEELVFPSFWTFLV